MSLRRFRWWAVLVPVLVALVAVGLGIPALGAALVVTDALQPSDAIFVLDGGTPVRELEAASLYRLGYAPRVVVARGRDAISVARQVSGEPSRQERAVRVLVHVGVPEAAVVTLSQEVDNTVQELAADFAFATKQGLRRVILVTSANHTRRVRVIWNSRYERRIPALVYPTSWEAYDAGRWQRRQPRGSVFAPHWPPVWTSATPMTWSSSATSRRRAMEIVERLARRQRTPIRSHPHA